MSENRVTIADVADALGLSTATVSNVIHGKTRKISDETVKRVQEKLEEMDYIPNMAGILLAQNNSKIIGVVINDGPKYEGNVLEDGFVMASLNALLKEVNKSGHFLMIKATRHCADIPVFASMWNMDGMILMGFCEAEYKKLRENMRVSFVVYDGYFEETDRIVNLVIDHYDGGYQAGKYLRETGNCRALCLSDNYICMDAERIEGFKKAFSPGNVDVMQIPILKEERHKFYEEHLDEIKGYRAVFAGSDYYALDFMHFVQRKGIRIPEDMSIIGFDDSIMSRENVPSLTTIHQDAEVRAKMAISLLEAMRNGKRPVTLQSMLQSSFSIVDQLMIGQLGENGIAAVGLSGNFSLIFSVIMGAIGTVAGIMIAQFIGAKDEKEAWRGFLVSAITGVIIGKHLGKKDFDNAYQDSKRLLWLGLEGSVILSVVLILLAGFYVTHYQVDVLVKETAKYLLIVFAIYAPVKVLNMILGGGIIRSGGDTKIIMIIDIIGTWLVGIPLCFVTAYGFGLSIVPVYAIFSFEEVVRLVITIFIFQKKKWMHSIGDI